MVGNVSFRENFLATFLKVAKDKELRNKLIYLEYEEDCFEFCVCVGGFCGVGGRGDVVVAVP